MCLFLIFHACFILTYAARHGVCEGMGRGRWRDGVRRGVAELQCWQEHYHSLPFLHSSVKRLGNTDNVHFLAEDRRQVYSWQGERQNKWWGSIRVPLRRIRRGWRRGGLWIPGPKHGMNNNFVTAAPGQPSLSNTCSWLIVRMDQHYVLLRWLLIVSPHSPSVTPLHLAHFS